ncbi:MULTISPECIES: CDP-alcohol phosphatidyltransferase family protein [Romboutsia]|uniref:CDP-alcohol phosphatidyltransferase n=1 Tax=Romboutsia hominis TaxID=1507512 RepID=A0A2P2BS49_9FIRM|nr:MULTISPECIES: CDP-alcohol phosphatidyltransferase family protein [Romboutsia]MDB8792025.1 CDP-alcohol phosphatidyltransferase family protein [Romboutsia sp. 1001216sp1]MDB8793406.1 CDP-alcohol phosphatidyltransferase family protein [Romboutsia sp. 1001216sp1]MDB8796833.1 CDP-alcohol phosphatidyltransferase family protein [Romboutsia sp. 1001216sp1]MDB8799694.1 CDP-alcohol phosphatidyltransferase family protein [Romboutsia sp. 1001216sp1]MDB8802479.1 CDP-alcohol phosphatidyltransferase famil
MLDTHARKYVNPFIEFGANIFIKRKISANTVTTLALILGVLSAVLLYLDKNILAVMLLWISGYLDAVDGSIARKTDSSSSFGTVLDVTFDRIVEIGIIFVSALKFEEIRLNIIVLLACILISMVIFLTVGAVSEKSGIKSFYYQAGVAERSEGFIMLSLMMIFESYLGIVVNIFSFIVIITALQRMIEAKNILK